MPGHEGPTGSGDQAPFGPTPDQLRELLYFGHLTRYVEDRLRLLLESDSTEIKGAPGFAPDVPEFEPSCVPAALAMVRRNDGNGDVCSPNLVGLGAVLAFAGTPLEYFRQCLGLGTSPSSGRTGGTQWTDSRRGILSSAGCAGTMTQVMAGVALAFKNRGEDRVALCFEPPWAPQTGGWHEGINFAAANAVPLIVVLQGKTALGTPSLPGPVQKQDRGPAYGLRSVSVAAGDLSGIFAAVAEARAHAVDGGGVTLIEIEDHEMPDGPWASLDRLSRAAIKTGLLTQGDLDRLLDQAVHEVDHAATRVEKEPRPEIREALVAVSTGSEPLLPWTRRDPPDPTSQEPLEPKEDLLVL